MLRIRSTPRSVIPAHERVTKLKPGWIGGVRPPRQLLRGFLRMTTIPNPIRDFPHGEERPKGPSRTTHNLDAANSSQPRRPGRIAAAGTGFRQTIRRSRRFGFIGASVIHPSQVAILNEEFRASAAEVDHARRIVAAYDKALAEGVGAVTVDGKMIDVPVVERARLLLEREAAIAAREARMRMPGATDS